MAENISRSHPVDSPAGQPSQSATGSTLPPAEELRRVAEEVRLAFPRPLRAPQLVLIDVDPRHLHAFWTLDAASVDAARRASAGSGREATMVLRVSGTGDGPCDAFDVEVAGLQGQCYVDIWGETRSYRGELGLRRADGSLDALAPPALVQLPSAGPAGQAPKVPAETPAAAAPPAEVARSTNVAAAPAAPTMPAAPPPLPAHELPEPVRHPFPLPPTEAGAYDPEPRAVALATTAGAQPVAAGAPPPPAPAPVPRPMPAAHELPEPVRHPFPLPPTEAGVYDPEPRPVPPPAAGVPPPAAEPPRRMPAAHELPEPVRHPFPLPPAEGSDYDPLALIGGFVPLDAPVPDIPAEAGAGPEDQPLTAADDAQPPAADAGGDAAAAAAVDPASLLPLENVLTLSSFALGRDSVEFEINAELHVFGRARPGTRLQLFGRPVPLRPDGSFSITRPLPQGALIFSSLLVADEAEVSE